MARKTRPYWTCRKCKYRNPSVKRKCLDCGLLKAKKKVNRKSKPVDSYEHYCDVAEILHGVKDERCCVCGRPKAENKKHDRDHDHRNGNPRGLACSKCNMLMKFTELDAPRAKLIWQYLERANYYEHYFPNVTKQDTKPEGHVEEEPQEG